MRIIWCSVYPPNLVRNNDFSLFMQKNKQKTQQQKTHNRPEISLWENVLKVSLLLIFFLCIFFIWIQTEIIKLKQFTKRENLLCMIKITKINSLT